MLDASKLNCHDFSGSRSQFLEQNEQQKINKLLPWINKARQNTTVNNNLLHELRKVTLISTKEEKFRVGKDNFHETDELLENRHARFVEPEEAQIRNNVADKML